MSQVEVAKDQRDAKVDQVKSGDEKQNEVKSEQKKQMSDKIAEIDIDQIQISKAYKSPTTTCFELRNLSDEVVAFKLKCTDPTFFTLKPTACGLLTPKECKVFELSLFPFIDKNKSIDRSRLLIETCFPKIQDAKPIDAVDVWEKLLITELTVSELWIIIIDEDANPERNLCICINRFSDDTKSLLDRTLNMVEYLRRENILGTAIVFLFVVFFVAFCTGKLTRGIIDIFSSKQ